MRKRLFEIIEDDKGTDKFSNMYDIFMMICILLSLIPLGFKETNSVFHWFDLITAVVFIIDYILRLITADFKLPDKGKTAFVLYPFTPMAIIDFVSVVPSLAVVNSSLKLLKIFRLIRTFRVFRAFKFLRYSKNFEIIVNVFRRQKRILTVVASFAIAYILISALIVFNVEPDSFQNFFDAVYWATISLTTVGYGDIYPVTTIGRIVTMFSSVFGVAIIALPSGVITAGYMAEIKKDGEIAPVKYQNEK